MLTWDTWLIETHGLVLTRKIVSLNWRILVHFPLLLKPLWNLNLFPSPQMDEDDPMHLPEMEAAQALAALARCSAVRGAAASCSKEPSSEDQGVAAFHENKYRMATSALISGVTDRNVPSKLCTKSNRWNSATKLRQNMTEDETEKRRLRRILANRESARQTISRRLAMHQELMRKAVDLSEENGNLKKEKELAMKEYNSLKGRNKFLKLKMDNAKKAEPRETKQGPKSSQAEKLTYATISSPVFLYNQPPLVPFFWSSVPSSNVVQNVGITAPGNPLFVFPLPWALPFPSTMLHSCSDTKKRQNETPSAHQCSTSSTSDNLFVAENNELSSKPNMLMKAASSCTRSMPAGRAIGAGFTYPVNSGDHYTGHHSGVYAASAMDTIVGTLPKKAEPVICHHRKPVNVFAATKARRRRKELMVLKNVQYHHTRTHSANS